MFIGHVLKKNVIRSEAHFKIFNRIGPDLKKCDWIGKCQSDRKNLIGPAI